VYKLGKTRVENPETVPKHLWKQSLNLAAKSRTWNLLSPVADVEDWTWSVAGWQSREKAERV